MDHFAMLTPHEQLVETGSVESRIFNLIPVILCGPLQIPGGPG